MDNSLFNTMNTHKHKWCDVTMVTGYMCCGACAKAGLPENCVYRRASGNKGLTCLQEQYEPHYHQITAEGESTHVTLCTHTPPHDTCCLATKPSAILTLPCTCIMGCKEHGLQAVLIELSLVPRPRGRREDGLVSTSCLRMREHSQKNLGICFRL